MDLQKLVGKRLLDIIKESRKVKNEYMVMVCDDFTTKIISASLRVHQINDAGVGAIVNVNVPREPLPNMSAIYFLRPIEKSWLAMLDDFDEGSKRNGAKKGRMYGTAHIFTTSRVTEDLFDKLKTSPMLSRTKTFKEVNIDFLASESRVFTLGRNNTIPLLYFPSTAAEKRTAELLRTANQITSFCVTMKEYPYIRYVGDNIVTRHLAEMIDNSLEAVLRTLPSWNFEQERGTLFIVDRAIDCVAPVMHEYTYQAMINDLLDVDGVMCKLPSAPTDEEKSAPNSAEESNAKTNIETHVLSEIDKLWVEMRHLHIAEALPRVQEKFALFRKENATANLGENASTKQLSRAAKQMTTYKKEMSNFTKHLLILEKAFEKFTSNDLHKLGELEQDMATGVDDDGKKTGQRGILNNLIASIQDSSVSTVCKLRLIMIYIISQDGIKEATRKRLFLVSKFNDQQQDAVQNLFNLGVTLQTSSKKTIGRRHSKTSLQRAAQRAKEVPLQLMRFVPFLHEITKRLLLGTLDPSLYPYVKEPPENIRQGVSSARSARTRDDNKRGGRANKWRRNKGGFNQSNADDDNDEPKLLGPRTIIFMLGGVTFSEMRCMYELQSSHNVELMIGSTSTLTATQYIDDLASANELSDVELDL